MEINVVRKRVSRVLSRTAYIYPSTYSAMLSGLAPDIVYTLVNKYEEVYLERFCCKSLYGPEEEPRSLETGSRLRDFPLILTSLHYELDAVNLARLLLAGGVEVLSRERRRHVVVAGGPVVMENPIPYSDLVDAFIIGEAEVTLPRAVELWLEYGDDKKRFLEELSELSYVYVPGLTSSAVVKEYVRDLNSAPYPVRQVENTEVEPVYGRGFKLEVNRGCPFHCSFCIETRVFQPYRERDLGALKAIIEEGLKYTISGKRVVLYSLSYPVTGAHVKLLEYLASEGFTASLPSLRLSARLVESLDLIKQLGQRTLTVAPESFSRILHSVFFKYTGLVDYVLKVIKSLLDAGFNLKLYLIYGVKGVEAEEFSRDAETLRGVAKYAKSRGRRVSVALNPLVPKPRTVFQWVGMPSREVLESQLRVYRSRLRGVVEARPYDIDLAIVQAQLALAARPMGKLILLWATHGGGLSGWRRAMRELSGEFTVDYVFTGYRYEEELPWSFIKLDDVSERVTRSQYEAFKRLVGIGGTRRA
jgi:radical SAM superfamily enzyme YgiQ (UPF0313 family)